MQHGKRSKERDLQGEEMQQVKQEPQIKQNPSMLREVVKLSYPSVLEYSFVALASMVDTYMVSNLGSDAVAAIGLTTQPKFIGVAIFLTLSIAVSTLVARRWGQKDRRSANSIAASAIGFCVLAGILVGLLYCLFADQIIAFCGSEPQTHDMAVDYLKIVMGSIVFSGLTLVVNAALRGCGNTKIAMYTNVASNLVNVVGNYLLIEGRFGFRSGVPRRLYPPRPEASPFPPRCF